MSVDLTVEFNGLVISKSKAQGVTDVRWNLMHVIDIVASMDDVMGSFVYRMI